MRLGIDIGGTNIVFGLFGENGQLVRTSSVRSFARDASLESTLQSLQDRIGEFLTPEVTSIGIGVPSALDRETGVVYNAVNIPSWQNVPLKQILEAHFHVPVRLNNDANCFALGAYRHFAAEKPQSFVGVTLGTGVGLGIVIDGELYNGHNTGAGEIGCIRYLDADLETYCSAIRRPWRYSGKSAATSATWLPPSSTPTIPKCSCWAAGFPGRSPISRTVWKPASNRFSSIPKL